MNYLCAVDKSEYSFKAVEYIKTILRENDRLILIHAEKPQKSTFDFSSEEEFLKKRDKETNLLKEKFKNLSYVSSFETRVGDPREISKKKKKIN